MKAIFFFVLYTGMNLWNASGAQAGNLKITPDMVRFHYATYDSGTLLDCQAIVLNAESQDWSVSCGQGTDLRKYTVHLWVTRYDRPQIPKLSLELLYWVNDLTHRPMVGSGTTVWLDFKEPSDLYQVHVNV